MPHKGLQQAYDVQDITFNALQAWKAQNEDPSGKTKLAPFAAGELAQLVKAWSEAQDRVRIQRNKPLPGVARPEPKRKAVSTTPITVLEPISDEQPEAPQAPAQSS